MHFLAARLRAEPIASPRPPGTPGRHGRPSAQLPRGKTPTRCETLELGTRALVLRRSRPEQTGAASAALGRRAGCRRRCPSPHMVARAMMVAAEVEGMCRHAYVPICPQQPCPSGTCFMAEQRCSWLTCCPRPRHHGEPAAHLCRAVAGLDVIAAGVRGRGTYLHRLRDPRAAQRRQPGCSPLGRCQDPHHPDRARGGPRRAFSLVAVAAPFRASRVLAGSMGRA